MVIANPPSLLGCRGSRYKQRQLLNRDGTNSVRKATFVATLELSGERKRVFVLAFQGRRLGNLQLAPSPTPTQLPPPPPQPPLPPFFFGGASGFL